MNRLFIFCLFLTGLSGPGPLPALEVTPTPVATAPEPIDPPQGGLGDPGLAGSSTATIGPVTLVAWTRDTPLRPNTNPVESQAMLTRLNADGTVRDVTQLADLIYHSAQCAISATGNSFLVSYTGPDGLRGRYLNASGEPVGGDFPLGAGGSPMGKIKAAAVGGIHATVWFSSQQGLLKCTLCGPAETPFPATFDIASMNLPAKAGFDPAIVAGDAGFLTAWNRGDGKIQTRYISQTGLLSAASPVISPVIPKSSNGSSISLGILADGFVAAWDATTTDTLLISHKMVKLTPLGAVSGAVTELFPALSAGNSVVRFSAGSDGGTLAVRLAQAALPGEDPAISGRSLCQWSARRIGSDGSPGAMSLPTGAKYLGSTFDIGRTPDGSLAAYVHVTILDGPGAGTVRQLLDSTGLPTGIPQALQTNDNYLQQAPAVAWDGTRYLCVWQDRRNALFSSDDIRLRALHPDGTPEAAALPLTETSNTQFSPAIAASNGLALAVWSEYGFYGLAQPEHFIRGRLISNGVPKGPVIDLAGEGKYLRGVSVAARPDGFLVSWRSSTPAGYEFQQIAATWVSREGVVSHPGGFAVTSDPGSNNGAIASSGNADDYLLLWRSNKLDIKDLYGVILPPSPPAGTIIPQPFLVCDAPGDQEAPRIVPMSGGFHMLWKDERFSKATNALYTAEVSDGGIVTPPNGRQLAIAPPRIREPAFFSRAGGGLCAIWLEDDVATVKFGRRGLRLSADGTFESSFTIPAIPMDLGVFDSAAGSRGRTLFVLSSLGVVHTTLLFADEFLPALIITGQTGPDNTVLLRWPLTRLFPARADLLESSDDLRNWAPVTGGIINQSTAAEGLLLVKPTPGPVRYYRIRADLNL